MRPTTYFTVLAATLLLPSLAEATGCTGSATPTGPLQNYCEYGCSCAPFGTNFYIQIFVPPGTTDCTGDPAAQALDQADSQCNAGGPYLFWAPHNGQWEVQANI